MYTTAAAAAAAAAAGGGGQLTAVDGLTTLPYTGVPSASHHAPAAAAGGLQNLDVVRASSLHDALDSLLIHAGACGVGPPGAAAGHPLSGGCTVGVLNPIDKLYSMQTSYFSCAD